ncbi:hypothetical protein R3P38DRAFT_3227487 [Favolaschia claudopus]|uniref:Uncharacterized protein n=1 Tax=Favolaschia claudopus TaxID=2862362 RepID=A0AAV9ZRP1_9AGAR
MTTLTPQSHLPTEGSAKVSLRIRQILILGVGAGSRSSSGESETCRAAGCLEDAAPLAAAADKNEDSEVPTSIVNATFSVPRRPIYMQAAASTCTRRILSAPSPLPRPVTPRPVDSHTVSPNHIGPPSLHARRPISSQHLASRIMALSMEGETKKRREQGRGGETNGDRLPLRYSTRACLTVATLDTRISTVSRSLQHRCVAFMSSPPYTRPSKHNRHAKRVGDSDAACGPASKHFVHCFVRFGNGTAT